MKYQIEKIKGMPDWFTPGIKCRISNTSENSGDSTTVITGYCLSSPYHFIDLYDGRWKYAEPIPVWEPELGEYCAFWDSYSIYFVIKKFAGFHANGFWGDGLVFNHVARIKGVDCACSVEELKQRTDWL